MKIKTQKKIILGILFVIFWLNAGVLAQYYYFDTGGKVYQQGCNETLNVRVNANGKDISVGILNLLLDPTTTIYPHTNVVSELQQFFKESTDAFLYSTSSSSSPSWVMGSNYTILNVDRNNGTAFYSGSNGLYGVINFKPQYNVNLYNIVFGMDYKPGVNNTTETTLSYAGADVIDPIQQEQYRTGTFVVLQEPCVADTKVPTIANVSITKTTQVSHLSGLSFSLKDEGGANGGDVPYIWSGGAWTGNVGGTITNQYGINANNGTITFFRNSLQVKVISLDDEGVSLTWNKKTWQDTGLNLDVSIPSSLLPDFGIEKSITLIISFYDRAGNAGSYIKTFNSPKGPTLISNSTSPAGGDVYVNLMEPIKLGIKDDWAGVDSGTIKITLSGINGTDYGPYVFSGSDLNLSGVQGNANEPDYYVNITNHEMFPTSGTIKVSVYAKDMQGTEDSISDYTFSTRPNCSEFQCCDPVLLDLGKNGTQYYTNTGLIISGGVNPTFSGDEQNITGVIDCNTEDEGLSVYDNTDFMFFADDDEITINGTGIMGVLSGNVLYLSYIIDSVETIIDVPSNGDILTTGNAEIQWHLTGMDDYEWLSGYYVEIYSGDTPITGGFVDGTGITESLPDGEYEFIVYPVDLGGHTGSAATGTFSIDTVVPSVELIGTDAGMCTTGGTYTITGYFSEAVTGIDTGTLNVVNGSVQGFQKISDTDFVWTVSAGNNGGAGTQGNANASDFMHYETVDGIGTITICDVNDSSKCITMQDENLGASEAGTGTSSYGYHYQRGNNHGFAPNFNGDVTFPGGESTGATQVTNCANYGPLNLGYSSGRYDSNTFIWKKSDWCKPRNDNLRGGENDTQENNYGYDETNNVARNVENRRGPCGEGYHVPSIGEWNQVLKYWAENNGIELQDNGEGLKYNYTTLDGLQFQEDFKMPFAGYRFYLDAKVFDVGYYAYLWSSSPFVGDGYARLFYLDPDEAFADDYNGRANGFSLRCFKDSYLSFPSSEGGDSSTGVLMISIDTGAFVDLAGNQNVSGSSILSRDYDDAGPDYTLDDVEIEECSTGTMTISGVTQVGCASGHSTPYSRDAGSTWGINTTDTAYSGGVGTKTMTVRVRDNFGNYTEKTATYTWTDVNPTLSGFSVENVGLGTGINWRELSNAHEGSCGTGTIGFSGFIDDGSHGTCTEEGGIITYVADIDTEYEGGDSCIFEITDDEGNTATGMITFTGIDTKKPTCEISYNENVCTSGDIALTMSATGAAKYSWNGFTSMVSDNLPHNVHGNGVYTGYVRDSVGNTGICTGEVVTFDNDGPIIAIPLAADLTAEECTLIQGVLTVTDDGGCGNGFNYSWVGFGNRNNANYSGYSDVVTGHSVVVSVGDSAGNISNQTLNYTWTDTGVQLNNGAEQTISTVVLTGGNSYNTTTGSLISLFGASEGNCGPTYISVSEVSCSGLSMDIDSEGNVAFTGNSNLFDTGSCTLRFSDDDGNSADGELKIRVDTVAPGLTLQGSNEACMRTGTFDMTGIFTEPVVGFYDTDIDVVGGSVSNLAGNGTVYTWEISMTPMVITTVSVPAGVATDVNGNPNTAAESQLTGMYDTAGPNKVTLSERTKVYSETSKFSWQPATDSGCAGVSGYIRELYEGSCSGTPKDSGTTGAENFTVSGLENSGSYCRRVKAVDNFGNIGEWSDGDEFVVDLSDIGCDFDYVQTCTNGTLQVTLIPGDEGYTDNGTVYLSWQETGDWHNVAGLATGVTYSGQTLVGYIWQPATEKFNSCTFVATNIIDKANPEITSVTVEPVPECTTGTAIATAISDEGCGQGTYTYSWNSNGYIEGNSFQQYLSGFGTRTINLKVKDNAGNESLSTGVVFVWTDSPISGNNFTGYTGVGRTARTVNWREMSEVSDGDCGSGTITFNGFVDTGTKGICTRVGDEITYTPNPNENGDDSCTIQVKDDEGGTKDIVISWEGIDTKGPSCTVSTEPLLSVCVSGSVAITLHADEEINSAVGGNISRGISGTNATGNVFANWSGNVVMSDLVGNTGVCEIVVSNINTGVLDAPVRVSPANGSNTNDNTLDLSWNGVNAKGCRGVSGYEVQIIPLGGEPTTGFTNASNWTSPELPDGEYTIKVKTVDKLGGESEWTEITITIDTEKPTCEIIYDSACVSGNVQLTMATTGADLYSWIDFDNMTNSLSPNSVSSNLTYYCYVKDLAGNTGTNSTGITNIKTGVLSAPSGLTIVGGTPTNDNSPEFVWEAPESDGCREVSGYIVQVLSGGTEVVLIEVDGTGWTSDGLPDGEYTIVVKTEDSLSGESEGTEITFVIDRTPPNCSIEVMTENCTNTGVEIKLSGDVSDILTYSRWNGTTGNFGNNITTGVYQNGEYTGYVYDEAGNEGVCTGIVGTGIQDQILISYTTNDAEGFECEVITGSIVGNTGDSCGKDDLSKFTYSRPGGISTSQYGTSSNNALSGFGIQVTITDGAGNTSTDIVNYTWNDVGVTLSTGVSNIAVLTGTFEKAVAEIIDLFGAIEGSCGTGNITVSGTMCSGASISVENGIISINPDSDLDGVDGYCEFEFGDNEGDKTITGKVVFIVDTKQPQISLTGTNLVCMDTDTFDVTGTFTEAMTGFELGDVNISGGTVSNFDGNGMIYTWKVTMTPMVETTVFVPAGAATDLNGNENTESNKLTGMYDNVGPNDVSFVNWQDEIYLKNPTIFRSAVSDQGCAGLSGYNWVLSSGNSCNNIVDSGFTTNLFVNLDNLSHEATYTLCVQTVDNFGNTGNRTTSGFYVDLNAVGCMFEETECSNVGITLKLKPSNPDWTGIYLSWTGAGYREDEPFLTQYVSEPGKMIIGYVYQTGDNPKQSSCIYTVQKIDKSEPTITSFADVSVPECSTGELNITAADEGCGNTGLYYSWDNSEFALNSTIYSLWSGKAGSKVVDVQVKDNVGNTVSGSATIEWLDSPISGNDITVVNVGMGSGINWRELSEVSDGLCGSGTVEFSGFVNTGSHGICTTGELDTILYVPNEGYTGSDSCTIEVKDDDEQTKEITITWSGIDTEKPSCTLAVQDGQSCTSGEVILSLSSNSDDVVEYSFDGEDRTAWTPIVTTGTNIIGTYTGYVKDNAGNISDACSVEVTGGVLDLDNPTLEVSNWVGYECSTGSITVTGNDNSCGISNLHYDWMRFENITNTNEIYSGNVGSQTVDITVFDGVGHSITEQVTYTWQNVPVTGTSFTVENVGTGITVDWFVNGNVSGGICELDDIEAISSNTGMCEISGHNVIYKPTEGIQGGESCTITITDQDEGGSGDIEIEITFTGVDTLRPTVEIQGGVGEQCTNENTFTVTGTFDEVVQGVTIDTLTGENVNIVDFTGNGDTYSWTVEMLGGTGRVWLLTGGITDVIGNELMTGDEKFLGNYDISLPSSVDLIKPTNLWLSYSNTINFEWSESIDEGCAGISGYILEICNDELCTDVVRSSSVSGTGKSEGSLGGSTGTWTGYWRVISEDMYGNTGVSIIQSFGVDARNPNCSIAEQEACTQGVVQLILTGDREISIIGNGGVNWNGTGMYYTGEVFENENILVIVEDTEGRTGQCEIPVSKHDLQGPEITLQTGEVNECEGMTIQIIANDTGCAGIDGYTFGVPFGSNIFQTGNELFITAEQIGNVGGITIGQRVRVIDKIGNETELTGYELDILDAPVTLSNLNYSIGIITGTVENLDIINILGASEGSCGTGDLFVQLSGCSYVNGILESGILSIEPDDDIEENGECELYISDNEGNRATGYVTYQVDTKVPGVTLQGTNVACMNTNSFSVSGIFTESVQGFEISDIQVQNGSVGILEGSGFDYMWTVTMMPMVEVSVVVPAGVVTDLNGIENIASNTLTGLYDNVGPESVNLNVRDTVFSESTTLSWSPISDSGCAGVSGYIRELYEGACGVGILKDSGFTLFGTENFVGTGLENSGSYCRRVSPVDNFGNTGTWSEDDFDVDLTNIGCKITLVEGMVCTSGEIIVELKADGNYTENGDVYLSWISTGDYTNTNILTTGLMFSGQVVTGYISQPLTNKSNYCVYTATNIIDQTAPTVESIGHTTGYECETITGSIEMTDEGCGSGELWYSWNNGLESGFNMLEYGFRQDEVGTQIINVEVLDGVGNSSSTGVLYEWYNSPISWNNFTGSSNVGNSGKTANWKEMSNVTDGICGSGTIEIGLSDNLGSKGECVVQGDVVTYTPYEGQTGSDICILDIQDDEGDTGAIEIYWEGIDTEKPSCNLAVQEGQSCTSGEVILSLSSVSTDVVEYSFDGITWTTTTTSGVNEIGTYTGYVKDNAGNTGMCNLEVTGGVLDLDEPELEVTNWIGYECSTGIITVTGIDNSCGIVGLNYSWMGFDNITNTNEIYSENVGSQTVEVTVYDGVGHSTGSQVTYTWQNIPVTGNSFIVENVGTGITVDWFTGANVSGGICELDDITATIEGSGSCEISGHNIIYTPTEGVAGEESCTVVITDGDEGEGGGTGIEIEITFTGVDTERPTVQLQGGIGEQCTSENTFTVTGIFSEDVEGVTIDRLTGENVNIVDFTGNGDEYEWTVNMLGGTGRVWILTGGIRDMIGNEMNTGDGITLGNYDNSNPQGVSLLSPESGTGFNRRTIDFEWTASSDIGCAGLSGYRLQICSDNLCNDVAETFVVDTTGINVTLQENGNYFWTVVAFDQYGNQSTGQTRLFNVESNEPKCSIVQSECSSSPVSLTLTGNKEISILSGNISWQQVSQAIYSSEITENIDVWAIVEDLDGQTGYCHLDVNNYDNVGPDFDFGDIEVNEGEPLTINIVANDTGCAGISGYIFGTEFGSGERQSSGVLEISAEQIGNVGGIGKEQVLTVIDNLGNITTKTGNIVIKDVKPTISETGTIDGVQTGEVIIDVIDLLGAEEGDLGTGDLEVEFAECINATGYISGQNLIVNMTKGVEGVGYCTVKIKDNEGSYSDVDGTIEFEVDTKEPVCTGFVFDPAGRTSGDSVSVSLDGCSEPIYSGDTTFVFTGNGDHTFVIEDDMGNTGEIVVHFTGFDREAPVFDFGNNSGYECQTGIIAISNAVDTGIGLANLPYSFDGVNRSAFNTKEIYSGGVGNIYISGYVRDGLGNYEVSQANYVFNDSKPTATGFSVYALSGVKVNWKELSNATDGACGSGKLTASISGGSAGTCSVSGDFLIYEPDLNSVNSTNNYDLMIYDDEGSSVTVNVEFKGVTSYPDVELVTPIDGLVLDPGKVRFAWKGQGNDELIDKYVYNIWSSNDKYSIEQTGLDVSIDLKPGAYHWNVYAKYIDSTTGGLSDTYSFNVAPETSGLARDRCPYGDFSNSYYDGTCEATGSHGSADMCGVSSSSYSDEQKIAYLYAYSYGITTMCPIETANLDGYLIRSHFAKMISEFAVNVLGKTPNKGKAGCDKFDDIGNETDEMKYFMKTACELELMGLESDGKTPMKSFYPYGLVTRAEFGTVLSRLLFGDVYNIKDESKVYMNEGFWYKKHLQALKDYGIMTKIDGDWPNSLERRGRVMLMLQRADEYGVFAGKIPAKNGVRALFDE